MSAFGTPHRGRSRWLTGCLAGSAWIALWPLGAGAQNAQNAQNVQNAREVQTAQAPRETESADVARISRGIERAREALGKEDPDAVVRELWPMWEGGGGNPAQQLQMRLLLGEAWSALGEYERGLKMLGERLSEEHAGPEWGRVALLRGRALLRMGRTNEAAVAFDQAAQAGADLAACALGRAGCLREFGRGEEAKRVLEEALGQASSQRFALGSALAGIHLDAGNPVEADRLLRLEPPLTTAEKAVFEWNEARLWCIEGRFSEAEPRLVRSVESLERVDVEVRLGALIALVRGLSSEGRKREAVRHLTGALERKWAEPRIAAVFRVWGECLGAPDAFGESEMKRLKKGEQPEVAGWAAFYLGKSYFQAGRKAEANEEWEALVREHPRHPAVARVWLLRADAALEQHERDAALQFLAQALAVNGEVDYAGYLQMRVGQARYEAGDFGNALNAFEAAWRGGPRWSFEAAFNAGLSALRLRAWRKGGMWLERLRRAQGSEPWGEKLELELALEQAREGGVGAEEALLALLKKKMSTQDRSAVLLSLAEWTAHHAVLSSRESDAKQGSGAQEKALHALDGLRGVQGVASDTAGYLRVLVELSDRSRTGDAMQESIENFLSEHPSSALDGEVCFLSGEQFYRAGNYAAAEERFLEVGKLPGDADLREVAMYVAGQCAAHSQDSEATGRALIHWDAVARMGGKLRWKARYQQASLKCHMGDEREGVLLYELLLKAQAELEPELLFAARCGRADALLSLARRSRESTEAALSEYHALADAAKDAVFWKTQALYKAAKAREEYAPDEALASLRELSVFGGGGKSGEDFWIFRAGFDAARILEKRKAWKEAIGVYESMARRKGGRAPEAAARARQLRLENFLWND